MDLKKYDDAAEARAYQPVREYFSYLFARGYPEAPLSDSEVRAKFDRLAGTIAKPGRVAALADCIKGLWSAPNMAAYAELMREKPI